MVSNLEKIKNLRDSTGLPLEQIKKALDEAGGDELKAREIFKVQGIAVAGKKLSRQVKEGIIDAYIHSTKKVGVLVEVLCETDFVARNIEFQKLAHELAMQVAAVKPATVEDLMSQPFIKDEDITIKDLVNQHIAKLGENIQVGRFEIFQL